MPDCTGQCQQPPPSRKVVELEKVTVSDGMSEDGNMKWKEELWPKDYSVRFLDPWKGDPCPKGVDRSPRCEVCGCSVCTYCGDVVQIG